MKKTITLLTHATSLLLLCFLTSCHDDDEPSKRDLITAPWEFNSAESNDQDYEDFLNMVYEGRIWTFRNDGTMITNDDTDPNEPAEPIDWTLSTDESLLIFEEGTDDEQVFHLEILTESEMHLSVNEGGIEILLKFDKML